MDRIVNSSKLTARRAVSDDRTSRHLATEIQRRGDSGWTFSDRRHNSLQERTSGRSLGPAAEPPRNSQRATGNRPARGGRSPLSKSPLAGLLATRKRGASYAQRNEMRFAGSLGAALSVSSRGHIQTRGVPASSGKLWRSLQPTGWRLRVTGAAGHRSRRRAPSSGDKFRL